MMLSFNMSLLSLVFQIASLFFSCGCLSLPIDSAPQIPEGISYRYVLPEFDINQAGRAEEIRVNREGFQYGPPLLGNTSYFPTGVLGDAMVAKDKELWFRDVAYVTENVYQEWPAAAQALAQVRRQVNASRSLKLMSPIGRWSPELVQLQTDIRGAMESNYPRRSFSWRPDELDLGSPVFDGKIVTESIRGETPQSSGQTAIPRRCVYCKKAGIGLNVGSAARFRSPLLRGPFLPSQISN